MAEYYMDLARAAETGDHPVAWVSSVGPAELLVAMGFKVFYPENHAAMLAAKRQSGRYLRRAEAIGYAPDICSYLRSDIGACLAGHTALSDIESTIDRLPRPSVLVYSTNQCRDIKEWFLWHADHFEAPCIGIESPTNLDEVSMAHIDVIASQLTDLIPHLEIAGRVRFDIDRLRETVALSKQCSTLWGEILHLGVARPSPLSFREAVALMGPAVVMRGTDAAVALYKEVKEEIQARVTARTGAQKNERFRVYFEGMPIWGRLTELDRRFRAVGMGQPASTYCSSWVFDALTPDAPFESMARAYTELFIVRSDRAKMRYLKDAVSTFGIDGILFHEAKTCPANSNTRYGLPERLGTELGLPSIIIYSDHVDTDLFDQERVTTQIEAFAEQMEAQLS